MKKFILALSIAFLAMTGKSYAQIAGITITGLSNTSYFPGETVAVTIAIKNTNVFSQVNYDVLFSAATTASSAGYSSYLQGPMVCSGADDGFNFNSGIGTVNTVVRSVIVPSSGYSGNIVVIAAENSTFLTCSAATTYTTFTILNTPTPTNTATKTATSTPTQTPTLTMTSTPTNTGIDTATNTATSTVTNTATNTVTKTATSTSTLTETNTATSTPTITKTPYPTMSPVFLPVGGFNPSVTPQYFKTDSSGNLMTTSSGGSVTVSGATSITGGSLIAIPPTNTNTTTQTPTGSPTYTPTITPTPIYIQDEAVTVITNMQVFSSNGVTLTWSHARKYAQVGIYTGLSFIPFAATATPAIQARPDDPMRLNQVGNGATLNGAGIAWYGNTGSLLGNFSVYNIVSATNNSNVFVSNSLLIGITGYVPLATITPTAVPVTVIGVGVP